MLIAISSIYYFNAYNSDSNDYTNNLSNDTMNINVSNNIRIANWNLQIFGRTKASNNTLMEYYSSVIDDYDIIFIQEIRNKDQTSFPKLCNLLPEYDCDVSSRAGRTSSKEQYGIIYKKGIELVNVRDYNPDSSGRWERPPIEVTFDIDGYELIVYNIHIKPDDVDSELTHLTSIVSNTGNSILMGDLNADCSYFNEDSIDVFTTWNWIIDNSEDTTTSSTDCTYDRIIINDGVYNEYVDSGVRVVEDYSSDHNLVWVKVAIS